MTTNKFKLLERFISHHTREGPAIRSAIIYERYLAVCANNDTDPIAPITLFALAVSYFFGVKRVRSGGKSYLCLAISDRRIDPADRLPDQSAGSRADIARRAKREREPTIADLRRQTRERQKARRKNR